MRCALLLASAIVLLASGAASATTPYDDPKVAGALAFCDGKDHLVTNGPLVDAPFAAKVVSDFVAPTPYNGPKAKVTVFAYQPRKGVDPAAWSGEALTASSTFTDTRHPSAEVTWGDITLLQVSQDFPPHWDGLLQLRMYTSAPDAPGYRTKYAATDIRVTHGRWQLVSPVDLPCGTGKALSSARVLAPDSVKSPTPKGNASVGPGTATPRSSSTAAVAVPTSSPSGAADASSSRSNEGRGRPWLVPLLLVGAGIAGAGVWFGRRHLNTR